MRRAFPYPILFLALSFFAPLPAHAQGTAGSAASPAESVTVAPTASVPEPSGLPPRPTPPRTLRAYWHVFIAYAIAWILLFGYVLSLGRRLSSLNREVKRVGADLSA